MEMMPGDNELFRRVDEVTHYIWDPIGVSGIPQARDEYNSYLTAIFGRVKSGDVEAIVECMQQFAENNMGLGFDEKKARKAAERMLEWKDFIENPA